MAAGAALQAMLDINMINFAQQHNGQLYNNGNAATKVLSAGELLLLGLKL
jgi:hypothetical protein